MITGLLIRLPLVFGLLLLFLKGEAVRKAALFASVLEFGLALYAYFSLQNNPGLNLTVDEPWIRSMGISFYVAMDGISLVLVLLTAFLVPLIILSTFNRSYENPSLFYSLILFMQMALEQAPVVVKCLFGDLVAGNLQERSDRNRNWLTTPGAVAVCSLEGRGFAVRGDEERMKAEAKPLSAEGGSKLTLQLADLRVDLDRKVDVVGVPREERKVGAWVLGLVSGDVGVD